jgi:hypothetical protein
LRDEAGRFIFHLQKQTKRQNQTKNMGKKMKIAWLDQPEAHDYPAAAAYLSLLRDAKVVAALVKELQRAAVVEHKAKDIFRASQLSLLGVSNSHVETDRQKISAGEKLSPLLLVRDPASGKVIIADGYHRLCAIYSVDEDAVIPCKII